MFYFLGGLSYNLIMRNSKLTAFVILGYATDLACFDSLEEAIAHCVKLDYFRPEISERNRFDDRAVANYYYKGHDANDRPVYGVRKNYGSPRPVKCSAFSSSRDYHFVPDSHRVTFRFGQGFAFGTGELLKKN